jgi:hypothetical protein
MPYSREFLSLLINLEKEYLGKPVPREYQKKYGKYYEENEIKSMGFAIAKSRGIKID